MSLLHSRIVGKGSPLIILHGFLGMGDNWKTLANKFAEAGFQVHLVDQRNHGRSFHDPGFSYALMAQDLLVYMDRHGIESASFIGHSMGGKTVMEFATRNPQRVSKMIVADIAPKAYPQHHQAILNGLTNLWETQLTERSQADDLLSEYVAEPGVRQFLLKNLYWVDKGVLGLRMNLPALKQNIEEVGKPLADDARFEGPTLFLKGAKSDYILPVDEIMIKRHFPAAIIDEVAAAGHWLHAENPREFYQNVIDFL
ncbi:alpha/beta fold hydrolase [Gilvibacter sediminis]|uniref:alpha/beta fold hydrolase n=1 Tax=Gilvibacter sediminis TaxID=379071 RepID=UPI0023505AAA|nr:alpha/beta fold hydrolase [Gilvibacter sediminis]MDC7998757.1 alpha/beta fold hydrolase [Gilvibacter sediminis]